MVKFLEALVMVIFLVGGRFVLLFCLQSAYVVCVVPVNLSRGPVYHGLSCGTFSTLLNFKQ